MSVGDGSRCPLPRFFPFFHFFKEGWVEAMGASKVYGYISESPVSDQSLLCRW